MHIIRETFSWCKDKKDRRLKDLRSDIQIHQAIISHLSYNMVIYEYEWQMTLLYL